MTSPLKNDKSPNEKQSSRSIKELKTILKGEIVAAVAKKSKKNNMQKAFLKIIEEKKAKGVDPIFTISADFILEMQVGQGAFAVVHRCKHIKTGFKIALKTYEKKSMTHKS